MRLGQRKEKQVMLIKQTKSQENALKFTAIAGDTLLIDSQN